MKYDLETFKIRITKLAESKGWSVDYAWLMYSLFKEVGELSHAIEHDATEEQIGEEFADIMHFLFQVVYLKSPHLDLNVALDKKIKINRATRKKTYKDGRIIKK